jgi:hypothetical protein
MALGIFAFAIVPLIGMMGIALGASRESIEASTISQIMREAEAYLAGDPQLPATIYFTSSGDLVSTSEGAVFQVRITEGAGADAAGGLMARKLAMLAVGRSAAPDTVLKTASIQSSASPVRLRPHFQ